MTDPAAPPPRKDPQARTPTALTPPRGRSRATQTLSAAAARGRLRLQVCDACGDVLYPPRDACPACLGVDLAWRDVAPGAEILAETTVHTSAEPYFRERTPWRIGTARLDVGPVAHVYLHATVGRGDRATIRPYLDASGNAVLVAVAEQGDPTMSDDPLGAILTVPISHARVLVTDGRTATGQAVVNALAEAGAAEILVGIASPWLPFDGQQALRDMRSVEEIALDLTDSDQVRKAAADYGGKTDILINTAAHVRPGGVLGREDAMTLRDMMEVEVFGLQRLARFFGPPMVARGADDPRPARAFVDLLSVYALANWAPHGGHGTAAAARHATLQCLRGEMRAGGVRVLSVFTGPVDDDWHQPLPPPKVAPSALAKGVVDALRAGREESFIGDVAREVATRWEQDPKVLERELRE